MRQLAAFIFAVTHWRALAAEFEQMQAATREAAQLTREAAVTFEGLKRYTLGIWDVIERYQNFLPPAAKLELRYLGSYEQHIEAERAKLAAQQTDERKGSNNG